MSIWFNRVAGMDTTTMAEIATKASVDWDAKPVVYRANGIGWDHADSADVATVQDAAESVIGYRPVEIDAPPKKVQE